MERPTPPVDDVTDPKVYNCPDDIETTSKYEYNEAAVNWDEPWAIDNTRIPPVQWKTHQPLEKFNIGRTPVMYLFVDGSGNMAFCSFNIDIRCKYNRRCFFYKGYLYFHTSSIYRRSKEDEKWVIPSNKTNIQNKEQGSY